jgi:hypothetical protein
LRRLSLSRSLSEEFRVSFKIAPFVVSDDPMRFAAI